VFVGAKATCIVVPVAATLEVAIQPLSVLSNIMFGHQNQYTSTLPVVHQVISTDILYCFPVVTVISSENIAAVPVVCVAHQAQVARQAQTVQFVLVVSVGFNIILSVVSKIQVNKSPVNKSNLSAVIHIV
jgi:hypothetical protein